MHGEDENRWSVLASNTKGDFFIATIENGAPGDTMATEEANARLIAAAPDLLDACQQILSLSPDYTWPEDYVRLVRRLSTKAIKKATK